MSGDGVYTEPCFVLITHNNRQLYGPQAGWAPKNSWSQEGVPFLFLFLSLNLSCPPPFLFFVQLFLNAPCDFISVVAVIWRTCSEIWEAGWCYRDACRGQRRPFAPDPLPPALAWGHWGPWVQAAHLEASGIIFLSTFNSSCLNTHHKSSLIPGEFSHVTYSETHCDFCLSDKPFRHMYLKVWCGRMSLPWWSRDLGLGAPSHLHPLCDLRKGIP